MVLWLVLAGIAPVAVAGDRLVVLPFENRSQQAGYNWVRDSFVVTLAEVINQPELVVVPVSERDLAYERIRLNPQDLLTRASMLRVAETAQANLALIGEFDISGEGSDVTISVAARLIEAAAGRLVANKVYNFSGPLADLQQIQGQLAWRVASQRDPSLTETREQFVGRLSVVPSLAFESYVKGIQTADLKRRENYLRRALREYGSVAMAGSYGAALYELGLIAYRRGDDADAARMFRQIESQDARYEPGLFYLGLAAFRTGDYRLSTEAFQELSRRRSEVEVQNNLAVGYLALGQIARGVALLQRLVANQPQETVCRFNYAYGLWLSGQYEEAAGHLRVVLESMPLDGEVLFLLARSLRDSGREAESTSYDNLAKRYLPAYAKWAVDTAAIPVLGRVSLDFDSRAAAQRVRSAEVRREAETVGPLRFRLEKVRQMLAMNDDVGAWRLLEGIVGPASTEAEVAYLRGVTHHRRGEIEAALVQLRAAVAGDPRQIEAHLLLARIYYGRSDRAQASAHVNQALAIDPANREAVVLKQQIESGR